MTRFPTLFLSHGGGPWPFMEDRRVQYARTAEEFGRLPQLLPERPKAVLVITGHWEADAFTVSTSAHPPMVYDYYGFPEHTYHLKYPAPGQPELAAQVKALLARAGLDCREDPDQGFTRDVEILGDLKHPQLFGQDIPQLACGSSPVAPAPDMSGEGIAAIISPVAGSIMYFSGFAIWK